MKKFVFALIALFTITVSANAMSYEQARNQALFLTDKMAYELNLTEEQYEAAYEINLDYLMNVNTADDLYGTYWTHRNLDLSYILLDWQYRTYCAASYFYRPLWWDAGYWHFGIYARYPHRDYYYFGRPHFYAVYRGGHSWRMNGGRSWYHGRRFNEHRYHNNGRAFGMRDRFQRGDYRDRTIGSRTFGNSNRSFGNASMQNNRTRSFGNNTRSFGRGNSLRESSTRATVGNRTHNNSRSFGSNGATEPTRSFTPSRRTESFSSPSRNSVPSRSYNAPSTRSFGSGNSSSFGGGSRSFGGGNSTRSFGGGGGSRSFGGHR